MSCSTSPGRTIAPSNQSDPMSAAEVRPSWRNTRGAAAPWSQGSAAAWSRVMEYWARKAARS